jgi:predicted RNA-binding Zn-ribbon protein involved in translation (DUF1610 family)
MGILTSAGTKARGHCCWTGSKLEMGGYFMPQLQATIQTKHHLIARYPCPKCDGYMVRIEPDKLGHNLQPFECSKCGYEAELIAEF